MRRHILHSSIFLVALFLAALPTRVFAALQITEMMYDPPKSAAQWFEVYNPGSTSVTMIAGTKGWRVDDGGSSKHLLVDPAAASNGGGRGSLTIAPQTFAIITNDPVGFIAQYGGSYSVIKSAISPNQTSGATIALLDNTGATVDSVTYTTAMGGKNDGNSLHRLSDGTLVAAAPDPGVNTGSYIAASGSDTSTNEANSDNSSNTDSDNTSVTDDVSNDAATVDSLHDVSAAQSGGSVSAPLGARIMVPSVVTAGAGSFFSGTALTEKGTLIAGARYLWNFGDGATAEGQNIFHTYPYPGTYAVVLTVSSDTSVGIAEVKVQATEAQVGMLAEPDGSLVLVNQSAQNLNIGLWTISSATSTFVLPKDTIVLGLQSLHLAVDILGMRVSSDVTLRYPNSMLAATASGVSQKIVASIIPLVQIASSAPALAVPVVSYIPPKIKTPVSSAATPTSSMATASSSASAHLASAAASGFSLPSWGSLAGLLALLMVGAAGLFYLRAGSGASSTANSRETYLAAEEFEIE